MPQQSILGGVIGFLDRIGVYDVVLPFLLVFTIVFAILEKTRILGTEVVKGTTYTKKNLNSMVAFVVAFFVIASAKLVEIVTQVSSQMVILLLFSVLFLLLIGSFYKEGEAVALEGGWRQPFMWIMLAGLALIFLNAITTETPIGRVTWLQYILNWIARAWTSAEIAAVLFLVVIIIFMAWLTAEPSTGHKSEKSESGSGSAKKE